METGSLYFLIVYTIIIVRTISKDVVKSANEYELFMSDCKAMKKIKNRSFDKIDVAAFAVIFSYL